MYRVKSIDEFMELMPRKKKWTKENITLKLGVKYKLHSPYSNTYFDGETSEYTNIEQLKKYIYHGNIYRKA